MFFHVLKTGGVSFRCILNSLYGNSFELCYDPTVAAIETSLRTSSCLEFHTFPWQGRPTNMFSGLAEENRWDVLDGHNVFTMLREPVDQAVSLFYHLHRTRKNTERHYRNTGTPFPETLETFLEGAHHFNTQTAFLSNRHVIRGEEPLGTADLERAKATLLRVRAHVGLTERFAESMNVFEAVTGLQVPGSRIPVENHNPDRLALGDLSPRTVERIRWASGLDLELYRFGRELFLEDLSLCRALRRYSSVSVPPRATQIPHFTPGLEVQPC